MLKRNALFAVCAVVALLGACSGKDKASKAQSMDQIYAAEGQPVSVRVLAPESFSVYLKYPATLRTRSESTAYASISDVVRTINVKVGTFVKRDQVILSFSRDNPNYQQAKLGFDNASSAYERSRKLFAEAGISRQDFDNIQMRYEMARSQWKAASDMIDVKAPIDGYLTRLNVKTTENARPGAPLFTISNQDGFEARFYVGSEEITRIRVGERARISEGGETLEGSVTEVSMIMDSERKAFPVTAFFGGKARSIVSGMSVDVSVETYRNDRAIVVPRSQLVRSGTGFAAFVSDGKNARRVNVAVGRERDLDLEIVGGLKPGDALVAEGLQGLADGALIKVVDSAANL